MIAGGQSGQIRIVNLSTGNCVHMIDSHIDENNCQHVNKLCVKQNSLILGGNPWIRVISMSKLEGGQILHGHTRNVTCIDIEEDKGIWFVSGSEDGYIRIWDLRAKGYQTSWKHTCGIASGEIHPNMGAFIFGDSNGSLSEWDLTANKCSTKHVEALGRIGLGVHAICIDKRRQNIICAHHNRLVSAYGIFYPSDTNNEMMMQENTPTSVNINTDDRNMPQTFGSDIHQSSYITNLNIGKSSDSIAITSGDGAVSIWRDNLGTWTLDNVMKDSSSSSTITKWAWDAKFIDNDERFVLSAHSDGICNLWDTARHVPTPIASYECGGGKNVQSITIVHTSDLKTGVIDRRHRVGK